MIRCVFDKWKTLHRGKNAFMDCAKILVMNTSKCIILLIPWSLGKNWTVVHLFIFFFYSMLMFWAFSCFIMFPWWHRFICKQVGGQHMVLHKRLNLSEITCAPNSLNTYLPANQTQVCTKAIVWSCLLPSTGFLISYHLSLWVI